MKFLAAVIALVLVLGFNSAHAQTDIIGGGGIVSPGFPPTTGQPGVRLPDGTVRPAPVVTQEMKTHANRMGTAAIVFGHVAAVSAAIGFGAGNMPVFAFFMSAGVAAVAVSAHYAHIANDPPDPRFLDYVYPVIRPEDAQAHAWVCPTVNQYADGGSWHQWFKANCWDILNLNLYTNAVAEAIAVAQDRMETCTILQHPCMWGHRYAMVQYSHELGVLIGYQSVYTKQLSDHMYANGLGGDGMAWSALDYSRALKNAVATFKGVK